MTEPHLHRTHPAVTKRLKRAAGHLASVVRMIEDGRDCPDVAQQLHAVEKAIGEAKRTLIQDHLDHCLEDAIGPLSRDKRRAIDELKLVARYL
jgi:uncharacterized protein